MLAGNGWKDFWEMYGTKGMPVPSETTASDVGISVAKLVEALSANHLCTTDT